MGPAWRIADESAPILRLTAADGFRPISRRR
jgi:hypothetical protein